MREKKHVNHKEKKLIYQLFEIYKIKVLPLQNKETLAEEVMLLSSVSLRQRPIFSSCTNDETHMQKRKKFSITDFFSKCDQIRSYLRIWSHLLKRSVMENFIFVKYHHAILF